jgi:hypothetical protein
MKDAITRDPAQLRGALRAIARKSKGVIDFPGSHSFTIKFEILSQKATKKINSMPLGLIAESTL